jgi:hypothetical protein
MEVVFVLREEKLGYSSMEAGGMTLNVVVEL